MTTPDDKALQQIIFRALLGSLLCLRNRCRHSDLRGVPRLEPRVAEFLRERPQSLQVSSGQEDPQLPPTEPLHRRRRLHGGLKIGASRPDPRAPEVAAALAI